MGLSSFQRARRLKAEQEAREKAQLAEKTATKEEKPKRATKKVVQDES